jgi:hypothetical protein
MKAEIIKASDIKPGDRVLLGAAVFQIKSVRLYNDENERPVVSLTSCEGHRMDVYDIGVVARITQDNGGGDEG